MDTVTAIVILIGVILLIFVAIAQGRYEGGEKR